MHSFFVVAIALWALFTAVKASALSRLPLSTDHHTHVQRTEPEIVIDKNVAAERTTTRTSYEDVNAYLSGVCFPADEATGEVNYDAPCNAMNYFNNMLGCSTCMFAHGGTEAYDVVPISFIQSLSRDYCLASNTPTAAMVDILDSYAPASTPQSILTAPASLSTFSDPIGSLTEVAIYWTPEVTGTARYLVDFLGNGTASFSAPLKTNWAGMIVPTVGSGSFDQSAVTPTPTVLDSGAGVVGGSGVLVVAVVLAAVMEFW
ncbi:hypothetical protein MBLNU230_g0071t1 [Neophaeotheca triangularis]